MHIIAIRIVTPVVFKRKVNASLLWGSCVAYRVGTFCNNTAVARSAGAQRESCEREEIASRPHTCVPPEGGEGALEVGGPHPDGQDALAGEEEPVPDGTVDSAVVPS